MQAHTRSLYLLRCAKDVSVVLAEPSNTSETSQRSGELVAMQRPEVGPSQRKLSPRADTLLKHETEERRERLSRRGLLSFFLFGKPVCALALRVMTFEEREYISHDFGADGHHLRAQTWV